MWWWFCKYFVLSFFIKVVIIFDLRVEIVVLEIKLGNCEWKFK